ncbi:MAG: hypothetical protein KIT22_04345, partial [Verrucomicrobiae bacterium]|nr:hypothetical protein [Verrucomicrobiae bacterium]
MALVLMLLASGTPSASESGQGVLQVITSGGVTDVSVVPNAWLYATEGRPPTPFVASGPFTARWEGAITAD